MAKAALWEHVQRYHKNKVKPKIKEILSALDSKANTSDLDNVLVSGSQTTTSSADGGSNVYTFTDKSGNKSTLTVRNGNKGAKGDTGKGISSTDVTYQSATSATTAPTGTWSTSIPTVAAGAYLWTRTVITYTDNTTSKLYSVARQGANGSDATVTVDSSLSSNSTNPVQNKAVSAAINNHNHSTLKSGSNSTVTGTFAAVAGGYYNEATSTHSAVVGGLGNVASAAYAVVVAGKSNTASGRSTIVIGGEGNTASGNYSAVAGTGNTSLAFQYVIGKYAKEGTAGAGNSTTGDAFIVGNGTSSTLSNAFRVTFAGGVYAKAAYNSTGADYAEMFEWEDGNPDNEDRRGLFAYVVDDKIRLATDKDTDRRRMGIISAYPAVVGDNFDEDWCGKYLTDIYGTPLTKTVHYDAVYEDVEIVDEETGETTTETILVQEACDAEEWIINPDYDEEKEYIPRAQRQEYAYWSFIGKLVVRDDGTCKADGYCYPGKNGIATACDDAEKGYYVMERLDDSHVWVLVR